MSQILTISIDDLHFEGKNMIGDLGYPPFHMFVKQYHFDSGDVVVDGDNDCYIEMNIEKFFDIAYETY